MLLEFWGELKKAAARNGMRIEQMSPGWKTGKKVLFSEANNPTLLFPPHPESQHILVGPSVSTAL